MSLLQQCKNITTGDELLRISAHDIGSRLVCPEYSKSVQEVKTYPLMGQDQLFALCWNLDGKSSLYATMKPSPTPFSYHFTFSNGDRTQLHTHDYIELAYVVEGEFRQRILGQDIVFRKGELWLIDKNCIHQDYLMDCPNVILFLGLSNSMFDEITNENISTQKIISFLQSALLKQKNLQQYLYFKPSQTAGNGMERCLGQLLEELQVNDAGSRHICKGLMMRIFRLLSTEYDFSLSKELRRAMSWIVFEEITDYIKEHYAFITIQDLAHAFHFHEDYFNRLIKSKAGITYSEYVQKIRLDKAEQLLISSNLTIDEIAAAVGYNNKGYFYKLFQARFGTTPYLYRKKANWCV